MMTIRNNTHYNYKETFIHSTTNVKKLPSGLVLQIMILATYTKSSKNSFMLTLYKTLIRQWF